MLIRSAKAEDLNELLQLSAVLPPGMTSMPFEKSIWVKKLETVEASLAESLTPARSVSICWSWRIRIPTDRGYAGVVAVWG